MPELDDRQLVVYWLFLVFLTLRLGHVHVLQHDVEVVQAVADALLKVVADYGLDERAVAAERNVLADLVGVENVAHLDVAVLKVADYVGASNLDADYVVAPGDLFEFEVVHAREVQIKTLVVAGDDKCS